MPLSPFDWSGGPFLTLYAALFVVAAVASGVFPAFLRPPGRDQAVDDPSALALLAGGRQRWFEAVVAARLAARELHLINRRFVVADGPELGWGELTGALAPEAAREQRALRRAGLLASEAEAASLRRWAAGPFLALAAFGAVKVVVGMARDRPVGILVALLIVTLVAAAIRWGGVDTRTAAGKAAVRRAADRHARLRRAAATDEMGLGVALFGTTILAGSAFASFHQLRAAAGGSSGDSGSGGDSGGGCGGGGCGGGGCGGCGS